MDFLSFCLLSGVVVFLNMVLYWVEHSVCFSMGELLAYDLSGFSVFLKFGVYNMCI